MFRVKVDPNSGDLIDAFQIREIVKNDFLAKSYFIGMRPKMELRVDKYYIHCVYANWGDRKSVYYLRISPDGGAGNTFYAHKLSGEHASLGI